MKKVIFLDIDGVLNTALWHSLANRGKMKDKYGYKFDPKAVANLKKILDETGADIVISSSWKMFMGLSGLQAMWEERSLSGKVIDVTPNSVSDEMLLTANLDSIHMTNIRGSEIKEWLMLYGKDVSHYVILDDMNDVLHEQQPHFVWIDPEVGITEGNAAQAIMILNHLQDA